MLRSTKTKREDDTCLTTVVAESSSYTAAGPPIPPQLSVIRRELAGWLAPLALTDDETAGVVLAVDEAAANAVRHAYGPGRSGVVELTMWTEPGTLCVEVVDHGSWVPPVGDTAPDGLADGGRGIPLMSSMAEAVLIHHDSRGSRVLLRHPVARRAGHGGERPRGRRPVPSAAPGLTAREGSARVAAARAGRPGRADAQRVEVAGVRGGRPAAADGGVGPAGAAGDQLAQRVDQAVDVLGGRPQTDACPDRGAVAAGPRVPAEPLEQRVRAEPAVAHPDPVLGRQVGGDESR